MGGRVAAPLEHIERVAALAGRWAIEMGVPETERNRWLRAVWLHDALRDAPDDELARWAPSAPGPRDLRHGPASAARAKADGETDTRRARRRSLSLASGSPNGTWSAVSSTAPTIWSPAASRSASGAPTSPRGSRLSPRWSCGKSPRARVGHLVSSGHVLLEPTVRFWNSLVAGSSAAS